MIITNSRYALVGYFITSYPMPAHGIIAIYQLNIPAQYNKGANLYDCVRLKASSQLFKPFASLEILLFLFI